jgi:DNA-binding NarL/FixJ family response regulator
MATASAARGSTWRCSVNQFPVIVVDDHCVVREGLAGLIECEPDLAVVAKAGTGAEALACFALAPDGIVVLDLDLPDMTGFELLEQVTARYPKLRVLVFSSFPAAVFSSRAFNAGAAGYLSKQSSPASVVPALRAMTSSWGNWCEVH